MNGSGKWKNWKGPKSKNRVSYCQFDLSWLVQTGHDEVNFPTDRLCNGWRKKNLEFFENFKKFLALKSIFCGASSIGPLKVNINQQLMIILRPCEIVYEFEAFFLLQVCVSACWIPPRMKPIIIAMKVVM